jgi:hypothetical protein
MDTIVDVVGAFWGLERLGAGRVVCGPLPWFGGEVECAHGVLPLPAPATLELMRAKPVYASPVRQEIITPTGALLIDAIVDEFATGPEGRLVASATGYGERVIEGGVNGLRMMLFETGSGEAQEEVGG